LSRRNSMHVAPSIHTGFCHLSNKRDVPMHPKCNALGGKVACQTVNKRAGCKR